MNYRHAFHAGNHADVFKHLTLTRLIAVAKSAKAIFQAPPWCPAAKRLTRLMIIGWLFSMA